jgi:hypothetical protein
MHNLEYSRLLTGLLLGVSGEQESDSDPPVTKIEKDLLSEIQQALNTWTHVGPLLARNKKSAVDQPDQLGANVVGCHHTSV